MNSEGIIITDADQLIIFANHAAEELVGYTEEEMLGRNCRFLQGRDTDAETVLNIHASLAAEKTFRGIILNYRSDGEAFWNDLTITPIRGADDNLTHFVSVQRNISELVTLRENLREQIRREQREAETARLLLKVARTFGAYSNVSDLADAVAEEVRVVCAADRSVVQLWESSPEQQQTISWSGWPSHLSDEESLLSLAALELPEVAALVSAGRPALFGSDAPEQMRRLFTSLGIVACAAMPLMARSELHGVVLVYWATSAPTPGLGEMILNRLEGLGNIAAVALENAKLLDQAIWTSTHDSLTGLPDRLLFTNSLRSELSASSTSSDDIAVLYVDIDDFKRTNDTLGHHAGDIVMRHLAAALLEAVHGSDAARDSDVVARLGGDEFVVLLSAENAQAKAETVIAQLRLNLDSPLRIDGRDVFVSASVGCAVSENLDVSLDVDAQALSLLARADEAMYRAKTSRIGAPQRGLHPSELIIDSELHGAVVRGEFTAYFQPQLEHHHRRRSTRAMAQPRPRPRLARRIRPNRGEKWCDSRNRCGNAPPSLRPAARTTRLATPTGRFSQCVRRATHETRLHRDRSQNP
ncbi:diguanylate cyclase (GGDEF)-like protein/PAS domain S-box-containing protein [Subtercola frigoramans]|uniref:Diguanylate cyclase (GGDEF)-like protein/PAS domain S-box-containing protein n=1 Tax=Subtercola frigoramans TaxID=120298 RepID=A0ABS2L0Y0_9MICO|nr:diguanylate cyclase (GGDEF)-like protein/PAS domain S-box-containing protein [Subtercola frigoramans]